MIKNLTSSSTHITVSSPYSPNIYNNGQTSVGNVRFNPANQMMEVYDGNMWQVISSGATVGLTYEADDAIRWALKKMREEEDLKQRMEKNPGLKDAYEKFQIMDILTKEEDGNRA